VVRESLRETLGQLYIKMRVPGYAIAARDVETAAFRADLERLFDHLSAGAPGAAERFTGEADEAELRALLSHLRELPVATALPWAMLARLLPDSTDPFHNYRRLLVEALDALTDEPEAAFMDVLGRRAYPLLDAALDVVRAALPIAVA
jgi:hypothetical protein